MGSRDFEAGSSNGISAAATGYAAIGTAHTHAVLCTFESTPGVSNAYLFHGVGDGSATLTTLFAYDNVGPNLTLTESTSNVGANPAIAPTNGNPVIVACSKAAGTVAPRLFLADLLTGVVTTNAGGSTLANRTTGAATYMIGYLQSAGAFFHDGHIGAVAMWNRALTEGELRTLPQGRSAWRAQFERGCLSTAGEVFVDLTQPGTIRDLLNPATAWTGGTIPAFGPQTIRWPGW